MTALEIIKRSLLLLGEGEELPDASELQDALSALNALFMQVS